MAEEGEETGLQGGEEAPMASEKNRGETNGTMPPAAAAAGEAGSASVFPSVAVNIWPPSKRTRDAVIQRLVLNLSTESILSKRYPLLPPVEASEAAHRIEEEAFAAAATAASDVSSANLDDGIATLQIYSREISKRMIETVKAKAASASGTAPEASPSSCNGSGAVENPPPTGAGEESSGSSPA